jgi:outer membrane protein assembly factor BamB
MKTRTVPCTVLVLAAALLASCAEEDRPAVRGSWPGFRATPGRTGCTDAKGPRKKPRVLWTFPLGHKIVSSAAVGDGTVYFGAYNKVVYALAADTGKESWRYVATGPVKSSPLLMEDTLYVAVLPARGSRNGAICALKRADGSVLWRREIPLGASASPAGAKDTIVLGDLGCCIRGFDARTGEERWTAETGDRVRSSTAVDGTSCYQGTKAGYLLALGAGDGKERWRFRAGGTILSTPAVTPERIFFGSGDRTFYALRRERGTLAWKVTADAPIDASPAVGEDLVCFAAVDGSLYGLHPVTGGVKWIHRTRGEMQASPILSKKTVYAAAGNVIFAVERSSGGFLWERELDGAVSASPALVDGVLYIGTEAGTMYALR